MKLHKTPVILAVGIILFAMLMIHALKRNPEFTPSQLVGHEAPQFSARLISGGMQDSRTIFGKGRWVVVNFWSTSCYVCRSEAAELEKFYRIISLSEPDNPDFLSINIQDEKKEILAWQKNYNQTLPVVLDEKGLISLNFGVTGTPETFLVNPEGIVRYRIAGGVDTLLLIKFISWLSDNPAANEEEATRALISLRASGSGNRA